MKLSKAALVAGIVTVLPIAGALSGGQVPPAPPAEAIPDEIKSVFGEDRPAWLAARALESPGGGFRLERLPEEARTRITALQQRRSAESADPGDCLILGPIITDVRPGMILPEDYDDLVKNSLAIVRGEIVSMEPGFFNAQAGSLLKVRIDDRLKTSERFWTGPYVYVYYPRGDFRVGSTALCKRDPRWPVVPDVGDQVLLFPHVSPIDPEGMTMATETSGFELVLEHRGQQVPPEQLRSDPVFNAFDTLDELVSYTRRRLEEPTP